MSDHFRAIIKQKLKGRSAVNSGNLLHTYVCQIRFEEDPQGAYYFFGTGDETFSGQVEPGTLRAFWLSKSGELVAMSLPYGKDEEPQLAYSRNENYGDRAQALRLLTQSLEDFHISREIGLPLQDGPGGRR